MQYRRTSVSVQSMTDIYILERKIKKKEKVR